MINLSNNIAHLECRLFESLPRVYCDLNSVNLNPGISHTYILFESESKLRIINCTKLQELNNAIKFLSDFGTEVEYIMLKDKIEFNFKNDLNEMWSYSGIIFDKNTLVFQVKNPAGEVFPLYLESYK